MGSSESFRVIRKVLVRSVVNDKLKELLSSEIEGNLGNLEREYEKLQQQRQQYLGQCKERDVKPDYDIMKKIAIEEEKYKSSREQFNSRLNEVKSMEQWSEYVHGTVDSPVDVAIGDNWHQIMTGIEVLLEDGIVREVREREIVI